MRHAEYKSFNSKLERSPHIALRGLPPCYDCGRFRYCRDYAPMMVGEVNGPGCLEFLLFIDPFRRGKWHTEDNYIDKWGIYNNRGKWQELKVINTKDPDLT